MTDLCDVGARVLLDQLFSSTEAEICLHPCAMSVDCSEVWVRHGVRKARDQSIIFWDARRVLACAERGGGRHTGKWGFLLPKNSEEDTGKIS